MCELNLEISKSRGAAKLSTLDLVKPLPVVGKSPETVVSSRLCFSSRFDAVSSVYESILAGT